MPKSNSEIAPQSRFAITACLALLTASLLYRFYLLTVEEISWRFIYLACHGALADLAVPFALTALGFFAKNRSVTSVAIWSTYFSAFFWCCDFSHYLKYECRINSDFLKRSMLTNWSLQEKAALAMLLLVTLLAIKFLEKKLNRLPVSESPARTNILLFCSMILLAINSFSPETGDLSATMGWDNYLKQTMALKKTNMETSTLNCIFSLSPYDQLSFPTALLIESKYFDEFLNNFEQVAAEKARQFSVKPKDKVWLHMQNSPYEANNAFKTGIAGIELDIHYDQTNDKILVCHDLPAANDRKQPQSLDEYFKEIAPATKKHNYLWLDYKNLTYGNHKPAITRLKKDLTQANFTENIFVESPDPHMIRLLANQGIKGIWAIFYGNASANLINSSLPVLKALIVASRCQAISMSWQVFLNSPKNLIAPFPVAVYTLNELTTIHELSLHDDIRAILTDLTNISGEN